jgi:SpoIIAA-like
MVERIEGMPEGVVGLRAAGKLTRDDYRDVMEPALKEAMDSGDARVLFVIDDYDGIEPGAAVEDIKTGLGIQFGHRKEWRRLAVVTDIDWMAKAMHAFAWAMPGELGVYKDSELEEAKGWVAG